VCQQSRWSRLESGQPPGCADTCGSSGLHLAGSVDDVCGDAAAGEAAGVGALVVVVAQVVGEVAAQLLESDLEVVGKGRAPALVEDRLVQRLTAPLVRGRPARMRVVRAPSGASACSKRPRNSLRGLRNRRRARRSDGLAAGCSGLRPRRSAGRPLRPHAARAGSAGAYVLDYWLQCLGLFRGRFRRSFSGASSTRTRSQAPPLRKRAVFTAPGHAGPSSTARLRSPGGRAFERAKTRVRSG
jgi:hypothetical protein